MSICYVENIYFYTFWGEIHFPNYKIEANHTTISEDIIGFIVRSNALFIFITMSMVNQW